MTKRLYISLIVSVSGIVFVYVLSLFMQPVEISIEDVSMFEGRYVKVSGMVMDNYLTDAGYQIIDIVDVEKEADEVLTVFSTEPSNIDIGDIVSVEGKVERYRGKLEVVTEGQIEIISPSANISLRRLSLYPQEYVGRNINTTGYVLSIDGNTLVVGEERNHIQTIASPIDLDKIENGNRVFIRGKFLYDQQTFSYYILSSRVIKID